MTLQTKNYFPCRFHALKLGLTFIFRLLLLKPRDFLAADVRPRCARFRFAGLESQAYVLSAFISGRCGSTRMIS